MDNETLYPTMPDLTIWQSYLDLGFHLFPINPRSGKKPYSAEIYRLDEEEDQKYGQGFHDATNDMGNGEVGTLSWLLLQAATKGGNSDKNGKYWRGTPQIGCATGPSELFVIDLDIPQDFKGKMEDALAFQNIRKLEEQYGALPPTWTVRTPRGGQHLYFRGAGRSTAGGLGRHIDTRSIDGYTILPPSVCSVQDKKTNYHIRYGQYEEVAGLTLNDVPIAPLPEWVVDVLDKGKKKQSNVGKGSPISQPKTKPFPS